MRGNQIMAKDFQKIEFEKLFKKEDSLCLIHIEIYSKGIDSYI